MAAGVVNLEASEDQVVEGGDVGGTEQFADADLKLVISPKRRTSSSMVRKNNGLAVWAAFATCSENSDASFFRYSS